MAKRKRSKGSKRNAMTRLLKLALIPLLVTLGAAGPSPKPAPIVMAVGFDGSLKITRNGKVINCGQLRQTMRMATKDHHAKPFSCKRLMAPFKAH